MNNRIAKAATHGPPQSGIRITALEKSFGSSRALRGVNLRADPGRITGLLGPNGSGKSTTLKCLLGLCRADAGQALIHGKAYAAHPNPSSVVGAVLDSLTTDPTMRGRDHLRVYAAMGGHPSTRVEDCIKALGMRDYAHRRVGGWSTGMRQRLSLATALLGDPRVVILDEPTNGLDPDGIHWVREALQDMSSRGNTVVVSSHVLAEFEHVLDDVTILRGGRTAASGSLAELRRRTGADTLEEIYRATMERAAA